MTRPSNRILILTALLAVACGDGSEIAPPTTESEAAAGAAIIELAPEAVAAAGIEVAAAERRVVRAELETTGMVDFDRNRFAHVNPRVGGRIESVAVDLGQSVRVGQVLARIDSIELGSAIAEYLQAKTRAELAQEIFERERDLFADRVSSEQEMRAAEAAARETEATLASAEERLHLLGIPDERVAELDYDRPRVSILEVRAPFAGTVVERHVTLGEIVEPQTELFQIADLSRLWMWVDVFERDLARVHLDDLVRVRVDAYPAEVFEGTVAYLSNQVDADTRTARARVELPNSAGLLRPGMFARVVIHDPHPAPGSETNGAALAVPESALQRDGSRTIVFVALGEGRFEPRVVETGARGDNWVEIASGLAEGESVAIAGTFVLKSEASKESLGGEE